MHFLPLGTGFARGKRGAGEHASKLSQKHSHGEGKQKEVGHAEAGFQQMGPLGKKGETLGKAPGPWEGGIGASRARCSPGSQGSEDVQPG